jgi:hypothetical protein
MKRSSERKEILLTVFFVLALACLAYADPITIQIGGYVTSASGSGLPASIYAGITFSGTYTYNSSTPDSDSDPCVGLYRHDSPYGMSMLVGGYEFKTAPTHTGQFDIEVGNDDPVNGLRDYYLVRSYKNISVPSLDLTVGSVTWTLTDSTYDALSSDGLPVIAPVLTDWDYNHFEIYGFGNTYLSIEGAVDQVALVPEPLTITLMIIGILLSRSRH